MILLCAASAAVGGGVGALGMLYLNISSAEHVVARWPQSADVDYASFGPYTLVAVDTGRVRNMLAPRVRHELRVLRGDDASGYGHAIAVSLDSGGAELDGFISASQARWTAEGVTLEVPSGHRYFIPARAFTGGR